MCRLASFIITPNSVLWHPYSDSHADILEKYGIKDNSDKPDFVKVEIVPPNEDYSLPIEKWEYSEDDGQYYIPEWYNEEEAEKACRFELKHWYAKKVITKGKHTFSGKVNKIIIGGNITINDLDYGSEILVYGKSKVEVNNMKNGKCWFYDKSIGKLNNKSGGYVWFHNNSTGEVNNQSGGHVYFYNNSTGEVNTQNNGVVWFLNNSTGKINNQYGGKTNFSDNSTGEVNKVYGGNVEFFDNSTGTLNNQSGGKVWFWDNSVNKNEKYYGLVRVIKNIKQRIRLL